MGYTTEFQGTINIEPPLNESEIAYLNKFADTRRMDRESGPYFVDGSGYFGQSEDADIRNYNEPPSGQPGLWCKWVPAADAAGLEWDGREKFYDAPEWMTYLIEHFLKHNAKARYSSNPQFAGFSFDHTCNGIIEAQGEDPDDRWRLVVDNNSVRVQAAKIVWED